MREGGREKGNNVRCSSFVTRLLHCLAATARTGCGQWGARGEEKRGCDTKIGVLTRQHTQEKQPSDDSRQRIKREGKG